MNKLVKKLKKLKAALDLLEEKEDKILMAIDEVIDELEESSED
jgi:vacuolar-type H+-ATPase subunit D/Vma8